MGRREGGWDQKIWLGNFKSEKEHRGAWNRLPPLLKTALVWAFLKNGPNEAEDLARLHDGLCYGERGPIALAEREEPRWMAENLGRLLPTLSWEQVHAAVAIFMFPKKPISIKNRRLKSAEDTNKEDTWGSARKGEKNLRPEEAEQYRRWLLDPIPNREDFLIWLLRSWDEHLTYQRQQQRTARKADPDFPPLPDPNGVYEEGRKFPVDMGEWWLQKQLFDKREGLLWGYRLWRTNGILPKSSYKTYSMELQRGVYPNGGLLCVRPSGPNAFIGGPGRGLSNFNALIQDALNAIFKGSQDQHVEALMKGLDVDAIQKHALGRIPYLLAGWWKRASTKFQTRQFGMVVRKSKFTTQSSVTRNP